MYVPTCHAKQCWETSIEHGYCADHLKLMQKKWATQVYFIRMGSTIKIGYSVNIPKRMNEFKVNVKFPPGVTMADVYDAELLATELGGLDRERQLHHKFDHLRIDYENGWRSEWFRDDEELMQYIQSIASPLNV